MLKSPCIKIISYTKMQFEGIACSRLKYKKMTKDKTKLLSSPGPSPSPKPCPNSRRKVPQKRKKKDLNLWLTLKSHGPPTTHPTP